MVRKITDEENMRMYYVQKRVDLFWGNLVWSQKC